MIIKDKNDSAEKNASFVGKSTITNTESKIITENNITNDQKFKLNEKVASNKKRTTVILGDSIIKDVEQHKIRKGLNNKERVFVKHFPGTTVDDMKNYIIPSKKYENDLVILHMGTNDLKDKEAKEIATEIVEMAIDMKTEKSEVMVSGIVPRMDNLNEKAMEVNKFLQNSCCTYNFNFIDNGNVNKDTHLNLSGLHLNHKGTYVLGSNFVEAIRL